MPPRRSKRVKLIRGQRAEAGSSISRSRPRAAGTTSKPAAKPSAASATGREPATASVDKGKGKRKVEAIESDESEEEVGWSCPSDSSVEMTGSELTELRLRERTTSNVTEAPAKYKPFPSDLDGYIEALQERIDDGYMPEIYQPMLDKLLAQKAAQPRIDAGEPRGLTPETYHRINRLKEMQRMFDARSPFRINVDAILAAYRSGKLIADPGKVTYWSEGKQLTKPRPPNDEEAFRMAERHGAAEQKFWVEQAVVLNQQVNMADAPVDENGTHWLTFRVNLPGAQKREDLVFLDDTGSCILSLFQADLDMLAAIPGATIQDLGWQAFKTANGMVNERVLKVQVALVNTAGQQLGPVFEVEASIKAGALGPDTCQRMSGMWMRRRFFQATAPDGNGILWISSTKNGIVANLTKLDGEQMGWQDQGMKP